MPIYEFRCKQCHSKFEALFVSSHQNQPVTCSECKSPDVILGAAYEPNSKNSSRPHADGTVWAADAEGEVRMMPRCNQLKQPIEIGKYLNRHPKFYHGELTFKGTRIPVRTVLRYIAKGMTVDEALRNWPTLSREAILEALSLATEALIERYGEAA